MPKAKSPSNHAPTFACFCFCLCLLLLSPLSAARAQELRERQLVMLETSCGRIIIQLAPDYAPKTCANFVDLVQRGFYNGLTFHRVLNWVAQGGCPNGDGSGHFVDPDSGETRYLQLETHRMLRHNAPGIVAMARSDHPNSGSCQFYIMKKAMPFLDGKYAVFGKVRGGLDVVYKLRVGDKIRRMYLMENPQDQPDDETGPMPDFTISGSGRRARETEDRDLQPERRTENGQPSPPPAPKQQPDSGF